MVVGFDACLRTAEAEQWLRRIHDYIAYDKPAATFGIVESLYIGGQSPFPRRLNDRAVAPR